MILKLSTVDIVIGCAIAIVTSLTVSMVCLTITQVINTL